MNKRYTKELLEPLVKDSLSWNGVCRLLGVSVCTGTQSHIKKRAIEFEIDFSHFKGQGWNKGMTFVSKRPIEDYLSNKKGETSDRLKKRLFREGLKQPICEKCSLSEWMGEELVFELDHINNNHLDNRLTNLMILCPNCHRVKTKRVRMAKKQTRQA